jgi:hypothetical protein
MLRAYPELRAAPKGERIRDTDSAAGAENQLGIKSHRPVRLAHLDLNNCVSIFVSGGKRQKGKNNIFCFRLKRSECVVSITLMRVEILCQNQN